MQKQKDVVPRREGTTGKRVTSKQNAAAKRPNSSGEPGAWSRYPQRLPTRRTPLPSEPDLLELTDGLFSDRSARPYRYLVKNRRIRPQVLRRCGIGWDESQDTYTIPLRDENRELVNVKWYRPPWSPLVKKPGHKEMWTCGGGRPWLLLWPTYRFQQHGYIIICEGELDAMALLSLKFPALTATGAAGKWDSAWNPLFNGLKVFLLPDLDEDGKDHEGRVARELWDHAALVRTIAWEDLR